MKLHIFGVKDENDSFNFVILKISFYATLLCTAGVIVNIFHRKDLFLFISTVIPALIFVTIFYFGRFRKNFAFARIGLIATLLLTVNLQWWNTYGSAGNMLVVFFAIEIFIVVFTDFRKQLAVFAFIVLNVVGLLMLEHFYPDLIALPENQSFKKVDIIVSFILASVGLFLILQVAMKVYINQKKRWENIFRAVGQPAFILSGNQQIIEVNETTILKSGLTRNELIGKHCYEIFHQCKAPHKDCLVTEMKRTKKPVTREMPVEFLNGTYMINCTPVYANNQLDHIIHVATDITEKKQAENILRENEQTMKVLFEKASNPIVVHDFKGNISRVNEQARRLVGYNKDELTAMNIADIDIFLKKQNVTSFIEKQTENVFVFESELKSKNGTTFPAEISSSVIEGTKGKYVMSIVRDISERKETENHIKSAMEQAREASLLKSAFLANMSHEIRTPMNGILGFAELLKDPELPPEKQAKFIGIIEESGNRMLNLINDLIDISKIEAKQIELKISTVNINHQLEYLHTFFLPEAKKKNLQLEYKVDSALRNLTAKTDKEKLLAILINLIKNAIKYTRSGKIEFGFSRKNEILEFYVNDTGIGIPKHLHDTIFNRFIQVDQSFTPAIEGAGLGLSIVKALVDLLGGTIGMESEPGVGSCFRFTIPLIAGSPVISDMFEEISEVSEEIKKLTFLLVDDDPNSLLYLNNILQGRVKQILQAANGNEAIEICKSYSTIDYILMDIRMPLVDGFTAIREILAFRKNVKIIAQSAYALAGDKEKAMAAGCVGYITKPISKHELLLKIGNALQTDLPV